MSRQGWTACLWAVGLLGLAESVATMSAKPPQLPLEINDNFDSPTTLAQDISATDTVLPLPLYLDCEKGCTGCKPDCCKPANDKSRPHCCESGCKGCEAGSCKPAGGLTCPHLLQKAAAPTVKSPAVELSDVLTNLKKLAEAERMMHQADDFNKAGRLAEAIECLEAARKLVPGSPLAQRAQARLAVLRKPVDGEGTTEEAEPTAEDEENSECPDDDQPGTMNVPLMSILQPILPPLDTTLSNILDRILTESGMDPR